MSDELPEVRFRIWDIKFSEWDRSLDVECYSEHEIRWLDWIDKERYVYSQFIGLNDMNGENIYTGDIVQYNSTEGDNIVWPINWDAKKACYCMGNMPLGSLFQSGYYQPDRGKTGLKVIGNIYENPGMFCSGVEGVL